MIHDVIADKFPHLTLPSRRARLAWRTKVALGRWQADAIATVSEYSKRQIIDHFRVNPDRVSVVGEASDIAFRVLEAPQPTPRLARLGLAAERRSIVYVGGFGPHKNLPMLVKAFAEIATRAAFSDVRLILVGDHATEAFHTEIGAIRQQVDDLRMTDRIMFTGYLTDEDLVVLLNLATVLVLPSLMEGFGLPAVEAAACGCPVIATTESPLPDLLGDGGVYIDPRRPEQLQRALTTVLASPDLRRRMRSAGTEAADRLTWEAAAIQLRDVIERVSAARAA
jgi:glycosyltransferase involved in cell wall biosynthesis